MNSVATNGTTLFVAVNSLSLGRLTLSAAAGR